MENFLKIRDKKSRLISFRVNSAQQRFNQIIEEDTKNGKPHRYIILKARQLGMSTFTEGYIFHDTATRPLVNSLIIAHEDKATVNLFNMSKLFYEELPTALKPMTKYNNGKELIFENPTSDDEEKLRNPGLRSKITLATAGTSDTARSGTYHNVHVSEIAFFPNPENTMLALMQCVPDEPNTFVCMESTANGIGGYFYDMWNAACAGENDFTPIFFAWFDDPLYSTPFVSEKEKEDFIKEVEQMLMDAEGKMVHTEEYLLREEFNLTYEQLNWRKRTIANKCGGDVDLFKQEYPATPQEAFIASGRPKFNLKAVKEYEKQCIEPMYTCEIVEERGQLKLISTDKGSLKIWAMPEKDKAYSIGADVAEGLATGDYSVGTVLDEDLNVVAKWRNHIDPDLFGDEMVKLAIIYNDAYLAVENNNHGLTTLKAVLNKDYYNIFYTKSYDKTSDTTTKKIGFSTNARTKPLMIDKLAEFVREKWLGIKDMEIVDELYTYVIDDKGKTNAQEGKHDDCVMSLGIALQAFLEGRGEDYVPEISKDDMKDRNFEKEIPDILDPLFERREDSAEYSE
ncbi:MAG: hypothetical protein IJ297_03720 [Clostridia bacterium]|nr:hypothetical protein [Clostridia bacterium]